MEKNNGWSVSHPERSVLEPRIKHIMLSSHCHGDRHFCHCVPDLSVNIPRYLIFNFRRNSGCTYAYYLMQQMLEWNKAEELSQALSLVLAIFHMDLEHLTHSMLLRLMPRLLLSTVHTHMLTDPRGFTLAKLCVLCITGTQTSKIGQKGGFAVVAHFYGFLHLLLNVCAMVTCVLNVCYDNRCPECVMVTCVCWHMSSVCTCCSLPVNQSTLTF